MGPSVKWYFKRRHFNRKRFWASLSHTVPVVSPLWWNKGFSYFEGGKKMSELANALFFVFPGQKSLCCFQTAQKQGRAPSAGQSCERRVSDQSSWGGQAKEGTRDSPQPQNLKGSPQTQ